jgi:hypothetical protein
MNPSDRVRKRLKEIHAELLHAHDNSHSYPSAISGSEREIVVHELLRHVLPPGHRIGSGMIVDKDGADTGQVDLVIEMPFSVSMPLSSPANRLYLAEGVGVAFEVKAHLGKQWDKAIEKVRRVGALRRHPFFRPRDDERSFGLAQINTIPTILVGFDGPSQIRRLENRLAQTRSWPDGILLIRPAIFYGRSQRGWTIANGPAECLFGFLSCLIQLLDAQASMRANIEAYGSLFKTRNTESKTRNPKKRP